MASKELKRLKQNRPGRRRTKVRIGKAVVRSVSGPKKQKYDDGIRVGTIAAVADWKECS